MSRKGERSDKKLEIRTKRIFSEEFKRQKVQMLVSKKISIKELIALSNQQNDCLSLAI